MIGIDIGFVHKHLTDGLDHVIHDPLLMSIMVVFHIATIIAVDHARKIDEHLIPNVIAKATPGIGLWIGYEKYDGQLMLALPFVCMEIKYPKRRKKVKFKI